MNIKSKKRIVVFLVAFAFAISITSISAATLMTWEGWGIVSKASVNSFTAKGQNITITNTVTKSTAGSPSCTKTNLTLRKKEFWGYSNAKNMSQVGHGTQSWTYLTGNGSTYDMYFATENVCNGYTTRIDHNGRITG